jgi:hypothetical protein
MSRSLGIPGSIGHWPLGRVGARTRARVHTTRLDCVFDSPEHRRAASVPPPLLRTPAPRRGAPRTNQDPSVRSLRSATGGTVSDARSRRFLFLELRR